MIKASFVMLNEFTLFIIVRQLSKATQIGVTKGEIQSSQHQQPRAFCCLQTQDKKRRA